MAREGLFLQIFLGIPGEFSECHQEPLFFTYLPTDQPSKILIINFFIKHLISSRYLFYFILSIYFNSSTYLPIYRPWIYGLGQVLASHRLMSIKASQSMWIAWQDASCVIMSCLFTPAGRERHCVHKMVRHTWGNTRVPAHTHTPHEPHTYTCTPPLPPFPQAVDKNPPTLPNPPTHPHSAAPLPPPPRPPILQGQSAHA